MRIRTIKPEFWASEDITAINDLGVRLLFIGLWSYVDDNGVGIDDYRRITADLFALEEDIPAVRKFVRDSLDTLSRIHREGGDEPLVTRYDMDGTTLLYITKWPLHQRVDRPNRPRYPRPGEDWPPDSKIKKALAFASIPEILTSSSRDIPEAPLTGTGEQGNRGAEEQGSRGAPGGRGSRLALDWQPSEKDLLWAGEKGMSKPLVSRSTERFCNHFLALPGAKALKLDWSRTWRNWLLDDHKREAPPAPPTRDQGTPW